MPAHHPEFVLRAAAACDGLNLTGFETGRGHRFYHQTRTSRMASPPAVLAAARLDGSEIHHTDRDCRYGSDDYLAALEQLGARPSMSRKGDCWDNAVSESFFATLEKELLALQPLQSRRNTRERVANYIESYYNFVRLHSHLDYVSPIEFETNAPS